MRFGIVDTMVDEMLKLSYDVYTLPQTIYIKDGQAYEMPALSVFYDNVRAFIEGNYLNESRRYKAMPVVRTLYNDLTKFYAYAYRDGVKFWYDKQFDAWEWSKESGIIEYWPFKQFWEIHDEIDKQFKIIIAAIVGLLVFSGVFIVFGLWLILKLRKYLCCS